MADRMLFVSWDKPVRGSEERAIEIFNEFLGMMGRMQQDGRIEHFDVALLEPNGELGGFFQIHGTADQTAGVRADAEFQGNMADAMLLVDGMRQIEGWTGDGVATRMAQYQEALGRVAQPA